MEVAEFHPGIRHLPRQKKKMIKRHAPAGPTPAAWRILPYSKCKEYVFFIDCLKGNTYFSKKKDLESSLFFYPHLSAAEKEEKRKEIGRLLLWNQNLRWTLKHFLNQYRIKKSRSLNDTDPITLAPFENPVAIYNLEKRIYYRFEASTIVREFHKKLTHNDGQIPDPLYPRNPLTNENFQLHQIISCLSQAKRYGYSTWATESFCDTGCSLFHYQRMHRKRLRTLAVDSVLRDLNSWQGFDMIFDFIRTQHIDHKKAFDRTLYIWAIRNLAESGGLIEKWKQQCRRWYIASIVEDDPIRLAALQTEIYGSTFNLCQHDASLHEEKKLYLNKNG